MNDLGSLLHDKIDLSGRIIGRVIAGSFLLSNVLLYRNILIPGFDIISYYNNYTVVFTIVYITLSYIIGDACTYVMFGIRDVVDMVLERNLSVKAFLDKKLNGQRMIHVLRTKLGDDILEMNYWKCHYYIRELIIDSNEAGFKHADRVANLVIFSLSMVIPFFIFFLDVLVSPSIHNALGYVCLFISVCFFIYSRDKKREEAYVIFLTFYKCFTESHNAINNKKQTPPADNDV